MVWSLDGTALSDTRTRSESATPSVLSLVWRVTSETELNNLRQFKANEGKVDVLSQDDGGFTAVDRANGNNTFTLTPPTRRDPLRLERTVHVDRYEEDLVSQEAREWDVTVDFIVSEDRTDSPTLNETKSGAIFDWTFDQAFAQHELWQFDTDLGSIATSRVDADVLGTGRDGVKRFELTIRFRFEEAHVWEAALPKLRGTRVKQIPDAPNVMRDETGTATVTVTTPLNQDAVSDGDYVLTEWESERITDAYQEVTATLAET
jgi:hypothetical protein